MSDELGILALGMFGIGMMLYMWATDPSQPPQSTQSPKVEQVDVGVDTTAGPLLVGQYRVEITAYFPNTPNPMFDIAVWEKPRD